MDRIIERNSSFQKHNFTDKKRKDYAITLRKKKRNESYMKNREENRAKMQEDGLGPTESGDELQNPTVDILDIDLVPINPSTPPEQVLHVLRYYRGVLSTKNAPLEEFVEKGIVPYVLPLVTCSENMDIRYEALWILCNIASGNEKCAEELEKHRILELFCNIIHENAICLLENTFWGLCNLMADSEKNFKTIIESGFLLKLQDAVYNCNDTSLIKVISWSLKNICHYEFRLTLPQTEVVINIISKILTTDDFFAKSDALASLAALIRSDNEKIQLVIDKGLVKECFANWTEELIPVILKIFSNICSGTHQQAQTLLDMNFLDKLMPLITLTDSQLLYQVYYTLSNIAAGTLDQLKLLERHALFYQSLAGVLNSNQIVKTEASYYLKNFILLAPIDMRQKVYRLNLLKLIKEAISPGSADSLINFLTIIKHYIKDEGYIEFQNQGLDVIVDKLQTHNNPDIYSLTVKILNHELD